MENSGELSYFHKVCRDEIFNITKERISFEYLDQYMFEIERHMRDYQINQLMVNVSKKMHGKKESAEIEKEEKVEYDRKIPAPKVSDCVPI